MGCCGSVPGQPSGAGIGRHRQGRVNGLQAAAALIGRHRHLDGPNLQPSELPISHAQWSMTDSERSAAAPVDADDLFHSEMSQSSTPPRASPTGSLNRPREVAFAKGEIERPSQGHDHSGGGPPDPQAISNPLSEFESDPSLPDKSTPTEDWEASFRRGAINPLMMNPFAAGRSATTSSSGFAASHSSNSGDLGMKVALMEPVPCLSPTRLAPVPTRSRANDESNSEQPSSPPILTTSASLDPNGISVTYIEARSFRGLGTSMPLSSAPSEDQEVAHASLSLLGSSWRSSYPRPQ